MPGQRWRASSFTRFWISGWRSRRTRWPRSTWTATRSPGASGVGSFSICSIGITPFSDEKKNSFSVSPNHRGRSPIASTAKTHSSP